MARSFQPHDLVEGRKNGVRFFASFDLHVIHFAWDNGCNFERDCDGFGAGVGTMGDWSAVRDSSGPAVEKMYGKACRFIRARGKWSEVTAGIVLSKGSNGLDAPAVNDVEVFKSFSEMSLEDPAARAIWSLCTLGSLTDAEIKLVEHAQPALLMDCAIEATRRRMMEV